MLVMCFVLVLHIFLIHRKDIDFIYTDICVYTSIAIYEYIYVYVRIFIYTYMYIQDGAKIGLQLFVLKIMQ